MGIITRFFGKSKPSKKAQRYLDILSSPTSNTPSARFSRLGSFFTGKTRQHRKRQSRHRSSSSKRKTQKRKRH